MEKLWRICWLKLIIVLVLVIRLNAVTVNPALCPTNKIAPHKRTTRWDNNRARTFGSFYNLFAPTGFQGDGLVEKPQEDAPDDCGDIEDYDENDLSSLTPKSQRRHGDRDDRFFGFLFPFINNNNNYGQQQATTKPPVTFRPVKPSYPPTRPPYSSGGVFSNNVYRPPLAQNPSVHLKPVHDGIHETQMTYRPGLVGAPSGAVVGAHQVIASGDPQSETSQKKPSYVNSARFPPHTTQAPSGMNTRQRPKKLNDDSIIGSFISLLFK